MGPSSPPPDAAGGEPEAWYGSIQYLVNISAVGATSCVLLFLLVKLRFDHRRIPGPSALAAKLLAVYHATAPQIALHCGADAAQFLLFERASFLILAAVAAAAVTAALPLNLLAGDAAIADQFAATTISHIPKSSPLLWLHLLLTAAVVAIAHLGISRMEDALRITRFRDGNGNPSDPNSSSVAVFTIMIQGIPTTLAANKTPLKDYFEHKYPGKVYRVIVPFDLCTLEYLAEEWGKVRNKISWLEAKMDARNLFDEFVNDETTLSEVHWFVRRCKELWAMAAERFGFTDEERLRKLHTKKLVLGSRLSDYKEGRAPGAGIAFVVFKDVYTANKAVRDFRMERKKTPIGRFFPVMELQLERSRWTVERAPPASDIYWNHLGLNKTSLGLRRIAVNTCLILMLLFFSSPLAIISGMQNAARIINVEAMDHAKSWLVWLQGSSWFWTIIFQFLPNVLIFVSMYIIIPSVLSYFSKFEFHLTVSGEQRAALLKMVCFFLVNLILLRALVESSLESWILSMGRCYLDGADCKQIEQYLSPSFLSRSSLSSLAFLITCTFLGISFDLLAPIPWIKHILKKFRKNDMVQLVPEENEDYQTMRNGEETNNLTAPLMSEREDSSILNGIEGHDLSLYPINRSFHMPKQKFDLAQYYAFDITIFALTMIYSLFAPLVVPVGAVYFGYRYLVDKYNFLFVYRVRGFPAGNDGKLMDRVLCIMQFCVIFFLVAMLLFFAVQGDSMKLHLVHDWLSILTVRYNEVLRSDARTPELHIDIDFSQCPQLQMLPQLVFALLRSPLLHLHEEGIHPDYRIYLQCFFSTLEPSALAKAIYPVLISYSSPDKQAFPRHTLSHAALIMSESPIFLLDAFTNLIVYYSSNADPSLPFPPPHDCLLRITTSALKDRCITPKLTFIHGGQDDSTLFENYLIEEQDVDGSGFTTGKGFVSFRESIRNETADILKEESGS